MLVRTFEVERGGPLLVLALLQAEGVGRARVEPDVENVVDLLPLVAAVVLAEEALGRAVGLANLCLLPFGTGLPLVAGALRDAQGSYDTVLLVCMGLLGAGVAMLGVLARTRS